MYEQIGAALQSMVTRGKVTATLVGPRTFLQITGLDGVVEQTIELLLPPGYSARPVTGSDVLLLQVLGSGDHVVALGGDMAGNAIADLEPGEFGLTDGPQSVVFRSGAYAQGACIEVTSPTKIRMVTPKLECTGEIVENCDAGGATVTLGTHTHISSGVSGHTGAPTPGT